MCLKSELKIIEGFVKRVNERAEQKMQITNKLEGSHYAAMMHELNILRQKQLEGEAGNNELKR